MSHMNAIVHLGHCKFILNSYFSGNHVVYVEEIYHSGMA